MWLFTVSALSVQCAKEQVCSWHVRFHLGVLGGGQEWSALFVFQRKQDIIGDGPQFFCWHWRKKFLLIIAICSEVACDCVCVGIGEQLLLSVMFDWLASARWHCRAQPFLCVCF